MNRFLTTAAYMLVTAVSFLVYVFLSAHWFKVIFVLIGIISGMRYFAQHKEWGKRIPFIVITIILFFVLFILVQAFGWIEYGK